MTRLFNLISFVVASSPQDQKYSSKSCIKKRPKSKQPDHQSFAHLIAEELDRTSDGETIKLPVTSLKWLGHCITSPIPNPKSMMSCYSFLWELCELCSELSDI